MAPHGRVIDVSPQQSRDGRRGAEGDFLAAVVATCEAGLALVADDVGFHGHAVADAVGGDGGVFGDDDAGGFVAEDVRVFDDHGADAAGVPEVDVGAAILVSPKSEIWYDVVYVTYPQIPVLLIAMVTSPGCKFSPCATSSCVGTASATQRSC